MLRMALLNRQKGLEAVGHGLFDVVDGAHQDLLYEKRKTAPRCTPNGFTLYAVRTQ